jgi:circadian clock protein KaiB
MASEDKAQMRLRLYVANDTLSSLQAKANLTAICREHLSGTATIEIVDILIDPIRCLNEGVLVTPTLVKLSPPPVRKIIGNLSDTHAVLYALGIGE